jgi:hypothetical protein
MHSLKIGRKSAKKMPKEIFLNSQKKKYPKKNSSTTFFIKKNKKSINFFLNSKKIYKNL